MKRGPRRATLSSGLTLPYVEQGDPAGVPVLLLHGYADSCRSFELVMGHLPPWIRALAVTQRGHGDADRPGSGYGLGDLSADLGGFMDAVGLEAAVIVGGSSGGLVAQRFAADNPDRTLGLLLAGAPRSLREIAAGSDLVRAVAALEDPVDPGWVREFVESTIHRPVPADFLEAMVDESLKLPARVWRAALEGLVAAEPPTERGTITAPTVVIWGDHDAYLPRADQEALAAAIPGSRLVVYEGTGHAVYWEEPERVAGDVVALATAVR